MGSGLAKLGAMSTDQVFLCRELTKTLCSALVLILLSGFLTVPVALSASLEGADDIDADGLESEGQDTPNDAGELTPVPVPVNHLDRHKAFVDSQVERAGLWVDGFFADPNNVAEATSTQFRLRPEIYYRKEQGTKFKFKAYVKVRIPSLGNKVSFFAGSEDSADDSAGADQDEDDSVIGLQFFLSESLKWNISIAAGVKFNDFAGLIGPRFRYYTAMGENSSFRFTQTFRWQTNNYWEVGTRVDLNFLLNERFFFRQTVYGRWRGEDSDEIGYRTRLSSVLSQKINYTTGLQYDFSTIFHTKPDTHVDKYTLALRFRKRTSREWLYYEIVPQVSFEDEFDYEANPGIRFRVEIFYGGKKTGQFWKRTAADDENFRW